MREKDTKDLILTIIHTTGNFDPINDKQEFENLIQAMNAYCQIGVSNRSYEIDSSTFYALRSKLANDLADFSDAWDHYEFQDNYENHEEAAADMSKTLGHMTQVKDMLNQMVEWFNDTHIELSETAKADVEETIGMLDQAIADVDGLNIPDKVDEDHDADGYDMSLGFD